MADARYVVLGLAPARSAWFRSVGLWANSGALPAEFLKCVSAEEVRARLASGRRFSALVADAGLPSVDRDLLAAASAAECAVLVVDDGRTSRDWAALGAAKVLPPSFRREELVAALTVAASPVPRTDSAPDLLAPPPPAAWRGPVAALTGPGGTGVSTAAIALAQAFGDDVRHGGMVLLADLRLHAEQAMLHDARDVVPGVQELVEAHRAGRPSSETVRSLAFAVAERRYHLLLGLRRARSWPALRPQAFEAAFDSLRRAYRVVVCDVDPDLEGEDGGGSIDVEERNVMARTAMACADVVFTVGLPSMKGLHSLVRVVTDLAAFGVDVDRIVPVLNRAPRAPRARAGLASVVAQLAAPAVGDGLPTPIFLPERPVEADLHDGARLPSALGAPLAGAFGAVLSRSGAPARPDAPEPVRPGSLGIWADQATGS
jgi:MinD-like ATPase involved in chromosome partitioning or flagellar assembly